MTPLVAPAFSEASSIFCLVLILLVPLACAGLSLVNAGLGRSRSAAHAMTASLCVLAVASLVFIACGVAWEGVAGRAEHAVVLGGKSWGWIAAEHFFARGFPFDLSSASLVLLLQMFSVGIAALIPLSSGAERWRLGSVCASSALLAGCTYPLFAHWAWGGGWLAQLGANFGLGQGFIDAGGSGCIQVVGGLTALSITWILGPRHGKYSSDGVQAAIPGHNIVLVMLGCILAWLGWICLNSAGAMLFANTPPAGVVRIAVGTTLCAAAAGLTAAMVTRSRFGRPDASLTANGWMAGLVASSAGAAMLKPGTGILVGVVAGGLIPFAVDLFELRLGVDDPGGAVSVHAVAGLWGVVAVSILSSGDSSYDSQWLAQLAGVATLLGFVLPLTYGLNWLLNAFYPQRVDREGEQQGLDLFELGAGAYPEFVVHSDEFTPR